MVQKCTLLRERRTNSKKYENPLFGFCSGQFLMNYNPRPSASALSSPFKFLPFISQAVEDINKLATGPKAEYIVANVAVRFFIAPGPLGSDKCTLRGSDSQKPGAMPSSRSLGSAKTRSTYWLTIQVSPGAGPSLTSRRKRDGITCST